MTSRRQQTRVEIHRLWHEGLSLDEIAARLERPKRSVEAEAWRAARWEWGRERRERMIAMWNDGESVHMIAREFGLTAHGVRQNLTDWRKRGEPVAYRRQPRVAAMAGGGS